jgi:hypothetical protein
MGDSSPVAARGIRLGAAGERRLEANPTHRHDGIDRADCEIFDEFSIES